MRTTHDRLFKKIDLISNSLLTGQGEGLREGGGGAGGVGGDDVVEVAPDDVEHPQHGRHHGRRHQQLLALWLAAQDLDQLQLLALGDVTWGRRNHGMNCDQFWGDSTKQLSHAQLVSRKISDRNWGTFVDRRFVFGFLHCKQPAVHFAWGLHFRIHPW
jgi:hypothetical protein